MHIFFDFESKMSGSWSVVERVHGPRSRTECMYAPISDGLEDCRSDDCKEDSRKYAPNNRRWGPAIPVDVPHFHTADQQWRHPVRNFRKSSGQFDVWFVCLALSIRDCESELRYAWCAYVPNLCVLRFFVLCPMEPETRWICQATALMEARAVAPFPLYLVVKDACEVWRKTRLD